MTHLSLAYLRLTKQQSTPAKYLEYFASEFWPGDDPYMLAARVM